MLGGHSFRVTGAQRLAALGVDVVKIMVLARWAGDSVLRYVREAPLTNLPAEIRALEEQRSIMDTLLKLQAEVARLGANVQGQAQEQAALAADFKTRFGPDEKHRFVVNGDGRRVKVHQVAVDGLEVLPQLWRTNCGVRFGLWRFTRHATLVGFPPDARCAKCFPASAAGGGHALPASSADESAGTQSEGSWAKLAGPVC